MTRAQLHAELLILLDRWAAFSDAQLTHDDCGTLANAIATYVADTGQTIALTRKLQHARLTWPPSEVTR